MKVLVDRLKSVKINKNLTRKRNKNVDVPVKVADVSLKQIWKNLNSVRNTVCPRSSDPTYIVSY